MSIQYFIRATRVAQAVADYMSRRGDRFSTLPGHKNLVYLEGMNPDFMRNSDTPDGFNDLRCVVEFDPATGQPYFTYVARCTCEPGRAATRSIAAGRNGGVARLQLIQYRESCMVGYHKEWRRVKVAQPYLDRKTGLAVTHRTIRDTSHPALVQVGDIYVHRDIDNNMKRTGDPIRKATGINHHSTSPTFRGEKVGNHSAGCCVGWLWVEHLTFIDLMKQDPRYLVNPLFAFDFALVGADSLKL